MLSSRTACAGFFCSPDQQSGDLSAIGSDAFLLEVVHQHFQGAPHLLLGLTTASNTSRYVFCKQWLTPNLEMDLCSWLECNAGSNFLLNDTPNTLSSAYSGLL